MDKRFSLAGAIALISLLCIKLNLINYLVMFLLLGSIPGTTYSVPSSIMLLVTVTLMWFLLISTTLHHLPHTVAHVSKEGQDTTPTDTKQESKLALRLRTYRSA